MLLVYLGHGWDASLLAQSYMWPTDASRLISSSFCEYRAGHLHAGIDIKTGGVIGFKAFAVRGGHVSRVRVSPFGYGRSLYLHLDTGETAVYAHLSRFSDTIESRVSEEQIRRGRFSVDIYFRSNEFPVQRGEIIAYTGRSGTSAPHLHFEMRDRNNYPINPLFFGLRIDDGIPPVIGAVSFTPLDPFSTVNGDALPVIVDARHLGGAVYCLVDTVMLYGRIGVSVSCYDMADNAQNRYAPYAHTLIVNDTPVFTVRYQYFSYDVTGQMDLEYNYRLASRGYGIFHNLYKTTGNTLPFYEHNSPAMGALLCGSKGSHMDSDDSALAAGILQGGAQELRIEVSDYFDNVATLLGQILIDEPPGDARLASTVTDFLAGGSKRTPPELLGEKDEPRRYAARAELRTKMTDSGAEGNSSHGEHGSDEPFIEIKEDFYDDYARLIITCREGLSESPTVMIWDDHTTGRYLPVRSKSDKEFVSILPLSEDINGHFAVEVFARDPEGGGSFVSKEMKVFPITAAAGGVITSEDGVCRVLFSPGAVYKSLYGRIRSSSGRGAVIDSLYRLEPTDVPLARSARVCLRYPPDTKNPEQLGVYSRSARDWYFVGNEVQDESKTVSGSIGSLGEFTVLRDSLPPQIVRFVPYRGDSLSTRQPKIQVVFRDDLSGIAGEEGVILKVDGAKVIAEYDPLMNTAFYTPFTALGRGVHTVSAEISDNSGNTAKVEHNFIIK